MFGAVGRRENQEPGGWSLLLQPHLSLCSSTSTQTTARQRGSILHQQPKTSPRVLLLRSQDKSLLNPIPTNTSAVPSCQPLLPVMILEGWKAASSTHLHSREVMWPTLSKPEPELIPLFNQLECAPHKAHPHTTHTSQTKIFIMGHAYVPH